MTQSDIYEEIQNRLKEQLVLVIGTGCSISIDFEFGMAALENHLKKVIPGLINGNSKAESDWKIVINSLDEGIDFENSLNAVKSEILLNHIITETGNHVSFINFKNLSNIEKGNIPIKELFNRLKNTFSYSKPIIDIITPNYDLIIEHALSQCEIDYSDGFYGGLEKKFDWTKKEATYNILEHDSKSKKVYTKILPHVKLHKVHGSLNYLVKDDDVVRNDSYAFLKNGIERFIITPGESKHKRIVENRQFYREMDDSIDKAKTYFFIGYGFNDIDIDKKIRQKINTDSRNAIIVTKDLVGKAEELITENDDIIAIFDNQNNGASISYKGEIIEIDKPLWQIDKFTKEIL